MIQTYIYDGIIALIVGGVPAFCAWGAKREEKSQPPGLVIFLLVFGWAVVVYGSFIEPRMLVTREYRASIMAPTSSLMRSMKIAVISDTHLGQYRGASWLEQVVERVNREKPDLVLVAGDVVSDTPGLRELGAFKNLKAPYGTYAVLGNWDYRVGAVDVRRAIESQRVEVLTNESVVIGPADAPLRIVGLDDVQYGGPDMEKALADNQGVPTLLLAHSPDAVTLAEGSGIRLVVAGHTHGGQIRLPFIGPVPNLPTKLGKRYDKGVFSIGPTTLFITSGVGESGTRARLFVPPEISILHLSY